MDNLYIRIEDKQLTDGSPVFDVVIKDHFNRIVIPAMSEWDAVELQAAIAAAVREHGVHEVECL